MGLLTIRWLLLAVWLSMFIIWFPNDLASFKERFKYYLSLRTFTYTVTLITIIAVSVFGEANFKWDSSKNYPLAEFGLLLFIAGFLIAVWAKFTMWHSWGVPGQHDINKQRELIIGGPFKFSRNPIYLGLILMFFGHFIALQSLLIVFAFLGAIYFYKMAIIEEKLLEKYFGQEYVKYKIRVSRFF